MMSKSLSISCDLPLSSLSSVTESLLLCNEYFFLPNSSEVLPTFGSLVQSGAGLPRPYFILPTFKFRAVWQRVTLSLHQYMVNFLYRTTFNRTSRS